MNKDELKNMLLKHIDDLDEQSKNMRIGVSERTSALVSKTEALKALVILEVNSSESDLE